MINCYGYTPDRALSKGDDCIRQRQTCCEAGTQSRESSVGHPGGTGLSQKIVWLPKAIGESGFSELALFSVDQLKQLPVHPGESSQTTRELCASRKAAGPFSPSFFFPFTHSSFLNHRLTVAGPSGPTAIPPFALNVGDFSSTLTLFWMRV